jgi:hypothetical protein
MGIACAEPPAYQDCMSPSQIPNSIFKQLTILVVAANAGIYTPRRSFWESCSPAFAQQPKPAVMCLGVRRDDDVDEFSKCTSAFSRRDAPEVCVNFRALKSEGAGNAGCTLHPRSRVQNCPKKTHTSIQVQRRQSDIPCAMVLRLISRSPRRSGFIVTVACDAATANLTPASRRQDHTTSPSA